MKTKETIGITLISLVVTIVVLMILAGVSINTILGDNGIIKKSQESANLTKETEAKEIMNRVVLEYYLVKKGETFEEFLQSKTPNTIDSVTKNEDGTFTISKNGYTLTIEEKIHRIRIKERKESLHYRNIVENMYTLIVEYLV